MPATELTVATRILAHLGALAPDGRAALRVGSDVVYVCGALATPATMTPYDVAALRLRDALPLAGDVPPDGDRYCALFRRESGAVAAAVSPDGALVAAAGLGALVERLTGLPWEEASARARSTGGLVGAYPAGTDEGR